MLYSIDDLIQHMVLGYTNFKKPQTWGETYVSGTGFNIISAGFGAQHIPAFVCKHTLCCLVGGFNPSEKY